LAGPKDTDHSGQDDNKYALDADELIAAALHSFDKIVEHRDEDEGDDAEDGSGLEMNLGGLEALPDDEDSYLEVVGLDDRLAARAERRAAEQASEVEIELGDLGELGLLAPEDPPPETEHLQEEHEELQQEHESLRGALGQLEEEHEAGKQELLELRRSYKDHLDAVRILEMKLRRREEALKVMKMERDDLSGTLRMWEKMVQEMRTAARKMEQDQGRVRRRHRKELKEIQLLANEKLFKKIIPALDNLELALSHASDDAQQTAEQVIEGIQMTATHLFKSVEQAGLEKVPAHRGVPFDPAIHDAVERVPDPDEPADTIAACLSAGYSLRGRLVRPARVSVFFGGPPLGDEDSVDSWDEESGEE